MARTITPLYSMASYSRVASPRTSMRKKLACEG